MAPYIIFENGLNKLKKCPKQFFLNSKMFLKKFLKSQKSFEKVFKKVIKKFF